MRSIAAPLRRRPDAIAIALVAAFLATGCAADSTGDLDEADAREIAVGVALREARRSDNDLYRLRLEVGSTAKRTAPSGATYWDVTLVDPDGIPRLCVRVRRGGESVGSRRCDPEGAPPPGGSAPSDDNDVDAGARS
jgi:hypothetical protein